MKTIENLNYRKKKKLLKKTGLSSEAIKRTFKNREQGLFSEVFKTSFPKIDAKTIEANIGLKILLKVD